MTSKIRAEDSVTLRFGGGINSRASEDQINPLECTQGENFILDPGNGELRPRPAFDLVGTAPNSGQINGFITLRKTDGTVHLAVQAGDTLYEIDSSYAFTSIGTVSSNAKLRGTKEAFWAVDDKVLITDLELAEEVHEWDGTGSGFVETAFLQSDGSSSFGTFSAKYCVVENERAFFGGISEPNGEFPHLLVASQRGDYTIISASDRPSSSLGDDAPFFLPVPQLRPINGLATVFGILAISQANGAFEKLSGDSAKNYQLTKLHPGSGATGTEAVVSTGNDIIYGALGKIESLESTDRFGDVELDDLSFKIQPDVKSYKTWTLVYNPLFRRVYCFPSGANEVWVLHTDFIGSELSPWTKFTTVHDLNFQPTAVMLCADPGDNLEYVFMGDSDGNVYRLEGTGTSGDGGSESITVRRRSGMIAAPMDLKAYHIQGHLQHRLGASMSATLKFLFQGEHVRDTSQTITLLPSSANTPYGGQVYYGGEFYYGGSEDKLARKIYSRSGQSNLFQTEIEITTTSDFAITEQLIRYDTAG